LAREAGAPRQVLRRGIQDSENLSNRLRHERRVPNRSQPYKQHPRSAFFRDGTCNLQRQTSLSDSSWSRERDEARIRISEPEAQRLHVSIATEKHREGQGQRGAAHVVEQRVLRRRTRARKERITSRTGQIERCAERAHGFGVRPPSLPTLERAHSMN
jgi:hypothetical protein